MLGTIAHQVTVSIVGIDVPWAFVIAAIAVLSLLVGLRALISERVIVLAAALGVLGAIGMFSLKSSGGSVLIPNNALGVAWTFTPAILAMVVVMWPRLPERKM